MIGCWLLQVRAQDSVHFMSSVAARRLGRDLAWQFFKDRFVMLNERYSSGFILMARLVKSSTTDLLGEERAREVGSRNIHILLDKYFFGFFGFELIFFSTKQICFGFKQINIFLI